MTSPSPTIPPEPGFEIVPPDFVRKHGAVEGMKTFCRSLPETGWLQCPYSTGEDIHPDELMGDIVYSAPLGTQAMLSTPLPEPVCNCSIRIGVDHCDDCPCHPRNRLVKVLPGWLAGLKEKPEGLMWAVAKDKDYGGTWTPLEAWPFAKAFSGNPWRKEHGADTFAYALPRHFYDRIMAGREEKKCNCAPTAELRTTIDMVERYFPGLLNQSINIAELRAARDTALAEVERLREALEQAQKDFKVIDRIGSQHRKGAAVEMQQCARTFADDCRRALQP